MQYKLQHGSGNWQGDERLCFQIDPDGRYWYVLQQIPNQGYTEIYASQLNEPLDERIFDHLARNHHSRALQELEKALKVSEKLADDKLTAQAEQIADGEKKVKFYMRQTGMLEG